MRIENRTHADCNRETMQMIQNVFRNMVKVEREKTARAAAETRQTSVVIMVMREGDDCRRCNALYDA